MQVNTLYPYAFHKEGELYTTEYFMTTDSIDNQLPAKGSVWIVVAVEGEERHVFHLPKPSGILKQPREIIEIIIQREVMRFLQGPAALAFHNAVSM